MSIIWEGEREGGGRDRKVRDREGEEREKNGERDINLKRDVNKEES